MIHFRISGGDLVRIISGGDLVCRISGGDILLVCTSTPSNIIRYYCSMNTIFPCPRSRLRIWSTSETGSTVPSRVSLLILDTQAEYGAYSRDSTRFLRRRSLNYTAIICHRASPEFIRSSRNNCVPTWRSLPRVRRHKVS